MFWEVAILHLSVSSVVAYFDVLRHYLAYLEERLVNLVVVRKCLAYLEESAIMSLVTLRHFLVVVPQCFGAVEQCFEGLAKHEKVHLEVNCHFGVANCL